MVRRANWAVMWSLGVLGMLVMIATLQPGTAAAVQRGGEVLPAGPNVAAAELGPILSAASYEWLPSASGLGQSSVPMMYLLWVPHVATGDLNFTLYVQNLGMAVANAFVDFYNTSGSNVASLYFEIPARGSYALEPSSLPGLPPGFEGSAVFQTDEPVQAVVNLKATGDGGLLSYTAQRLGSMQAFAPLIMRNYSNWNTSLWIQNTGTAPATVTISFRSTSGSVYNTSDEIPVLASHVYRQADMPELGSTFTGWATIVADQPVAAVVETENTTNASTSAYRAISPASTSLLFPRQQKSVDGWNSSVQVVNLGGADATLNADWYTGSGSLQASESSVLAPEGNQSYLLSAIAGLPSGFDGSLRLLADQPLAAVATFQNPEATGDGQAMLGGLGSGQLATDACLPRVAYVADAGLSTEISIQNGSGTDAATVTITYYDQNGAVTTTTSDSIPAYGVARYDTAAQPALGSDWQGSAIVNASQPIAVEVMQVIRYVPPPCDAPLTGVSIDGPTSGDPDTSYAFTAVTTPLDATPPITYTWTPAPDSGQATATAEYAWAGPGVYSLTLTAENCGGTVSGTHAIVVGSAITTPIEPGTGGTLVYTNTEGVTTTVQVPPNGVDQPISLVYVPQQPESPPAGFAFAGIGFELDAFQDGTLVSGLLFAEPVTVTIHYSNADVAGLDEDSLTLTYWTGSTWEDAACGPVERHPDENWLAVPICHLTRFGLLGVPGPRVYLPLVVRAVP